MVITSKIDEFLIPESSNLAVVLERLSRFKGRGLVCVDGRNRLLGVITLGDISNWLLKKGSFDIDQSITEFINRDCYYITSDIIDTITIRSDFNLVPVVDESHHVIAVALNKDAYGGMRLTDDIVVGDSNPVFVIAEIGNNHNGSLVRAKELIELAHGSGANCAKFQMRNMVELYGRIDTGAAQNLGAEYTMDLLSKFQLSNDELFEAMSFAQSLGLVAMCTPWDHNSVFELEKFGVPAYKIASADLTNHELLRKVAQTHKPMFCSTGMAAEEEILEAATVLDKAGAPYMFLHCNSTYPTPFKDVNLSYMDKLKGFGCGYVGYSGHERGFAVPLAAVARGACVIEKHFTVDRSLEGNDHKVSLLPGEFRCMVKSIREIEDALGSSDERKLSQGEMMNRVTLAKSIFAREPINAGEVIRADQLEVKSPGHGLQPNMLPRLIGTVAKRNIRPDEVFYRSDIAEDVFQPRPYNFWSRWGVPVRHHDFRELYDACRPPVLEFHLSYRDLLLDNSSIFEEKMNADLVVHAPELFEGDHILDLASLDDSYRIQSLDHMHRTIEFALDLKKYFANRFPTVGIVTNVGGFSSDGPLSSDEVAWRTEKLEQSISSLKVEGVDIWPQTMPPFPWHFGGQKFHNMFLDAEWIVDFCTRNQLKICLDISHSALFCNHVRQPLSTFVDQVLPFTAHLHLADAFGVDGEGLQIGDGNIDFYSLSSQLRRLAPESSWIPEIWQGHEDAGVGFWKAFERLEKAKF